MPSHPLIEKAQALRPRLEPLTDQIEKDRKLPSFLADEMAEAGFFKMLVPKDYGGSEIDPEDYFYVLEEIAKVDGSTAWVAGLLACNSISSGYFSPQVAEEMFTDPKAGVAGSLAPAIRPATEPPNQAVVVDGGYQLSGSWSFASGCMHATYMIALCSIVGQEEQRWFFFPKHQCEIVENWQTMGMRGTGSHGFVVKELFVPQERTLPASSTIVPVHPAPLYAFSAGPAFGTRHIPLAGVSTSTLIGVCLGIARGMIDSFVEISGVTNGFSRLKDNTLVQDKVGRAEAILRAARAYQLQTLREAWQQVKRQGRVDSEYLKELTLAGAHTALLAAEAVDLIWSAAAITSVFVPGPFERRFRDIHVARQNGGVSPSIYTLAGKHLMG